MNEFIQREIHLSEKRESFNAGYRSGQEFAAHLARKYIDRALGLGIMIGFVVAAAVAVVMGLVP